MVVKSILVRKGPWDYVYTADIHVKPPGSSLWRCRIGFLMVGYHLFFKTFHYSLLNYFIFFYLLSTYVQEYISIFGEKSFNFVALIHSYHH